MEQNIEGKIYNASTVPECCYQLLDIIVQMFYYKSKIGHRTKHAKKQFIRHKQNKYNLLNTC